MHCPRSDLQAAISDAYFLATRSFHQVDCMMSLGRLRRDRVGLDSSVIGWAQGRERKFISYQLRSGFLHFELYP